MDRATTRRGAEPSTVFRARPATRVGAERTLAEVAAIRAGDHRRSSPEGILHLQRSAGNAAVGSLFTRRLESPRIGVQRKKATVLTNSGPSQSRPENVDRR